MNLGFIYTVLTPMLAVEDTVTRWWGTDALMMVMLVGVGFGRRQRFFLSEQIGLCFGASVFSKLDPHRVVVVHRSRPCLVLPCLPSTKVDCTNVRELDRFDLDTRSISC